MKRTTLLGTIAALVLSVLPAIALAAPGTGAHFNSASDSIDSSTGQLVADFVIAGLGNTGGADHVTLSASASALYQCFNNGGQHPQAGNKETVTTPVSASGDFPVTKNGSVSGELKAGPPGAGSFSCPGGQTLYLQSVSYTNVSLSDTNGASTTLPDRSATGIHLQM